MNRLIKSCCAVVLTLLSGQALAVETVDLRIISNKECVFGDADLILRDFIKDASFHYETSKLVLEIRNTDNNKLVLSELLVDLSHQDRAKDPFNRVFDSGLVIPLKDLDNSTYSVALCKLGSGEAESCADLKPQSFDEMFEEHLHSEQNSKQFDKLYYFRQFKVHGTVIETRDVPEDPRDAVRSMPIEESRGELVLRLPRNDAQHCSLPDA